jgi:hypothetical protein
MLGAGVAASVLPSGQHLPTARSATDVPHLYEVYGTCAMRHCGLNAHTEPDDGAPVVDRIADETVIKVLCQAVGARFVYPPGQVSRIWDLLTDRRWVSDLYVRTPHSSEGVFSPQIERCAKR